MSQDEAKTPGKLPEGPEMIALMRQGVVEALQEHRRIGNPVVAWDREANRAVRIPPEDIPHVDPQATPNRATRVASAP